MRALILVMATGCGLGPAPDFRAPSDGNGIAPWRELGAPTVCLGDTAIDQPTAAIGGLCLSPLTPATSACDRDGECRSREACICGRCVVPYCASNSDCESSRTCDFTTHRCDQTCATSADCAANEDCLVGACRGRCATSVECQHGEVCDRNHVCITDDCADAADCFPGETCEVQRRPHTTLEPSPLVAPDGALWLYLEIDGAVYRAIASTTAPIGMHFVVDPVTPVVADAHAPSAIVDADGTVTLAFERADAIHVVTSADGVAFSAPALLLALAHEPALVRADLAYYTRDGSIGLYDGTDRGVVLAPADVQVGDATDPTSPYWDPITRLASPHAIVSGPPGAETVHLYFSAFGQESAPATKFGNPQVIPPNYSIGFAAAEPGTPEALAVWPYGPIVDHVEVFLEHHDELGPGIVDFDARWLLYYVDSETDLGKLRALAGR